MARTRAIRSRVPGGQPRWLGGVITLLLLLTALPMDIIQPAAAQGDGSTVGIAVRKFDCPPGFEAYTSNLNGLFNNCTVPQPGIPFSLTTDDGTYQNDTRSTGDAGGSEVGWSNVPLNTSFTLQEQIPAGYGLPMIACAAYAQPWDGNGPVDFPQFQYGEGSISLYLDPYWANYPYINCYWFNVPLPDHGGQTNGHDQLGGGGSVTLRKYTCWLDYDENNPTPAYDYLTNQCSPGYPGARLQARPDNQNQWTDIPLTNEGIGAWDEYPGGGMTIRELEPWPHPVNAVVYCSQIDDQGSSGAYETGYQQGAEVRFDLPPGWGISCDWFNIFYPSVHVVKYVCNNQADYRHAPVEELLQHCQPGEGHDFELQNAVATTQTTRSDGRLAYFFTMDQPSEPVSIRETLSPDYPYVRVFCSATQRGSYPDDWAEMQTSEPGLYEYEHDQYAQVGCAYFNIPAYQNGDGGQYGTVTIYKLVCDAGYDGSSDDHQDYIDNCAEQDAVEFEITGPGGYAETQTVANGYAQWDKSVPYGEIRIQEHPSPGYATWKVFCGGYVDDPSEIASYDAIPTTGNAIAGPISEGINIVCYWVNYPVDVDYHTVTIYKLVCAEGYASTSEDHQTYIDDCDELDGVQYEVTGPNGYAETQTVANGYAQWDKTVPAGDIAIRELPAAGYATWRVFCGVYQDDPSEIQAYQPVQVTNGDRVEGFLQEGWNLVCYWVNQYQGDEGGTIIVTKYYCPPLNFVTIPTRDDYAQACEPAGAGVPFTVYQGGAPETIATGPDSRAVFDGYAPGGVTIAEEVAADVPPPAIYCRDYPAGGSPGEWQDASTNDWSHDWDLQDGYVLECHWFNQRVDHGGTVTIYKYECPATHDGASTYHQDYIDACAEQDGVRYELSGPNGYGEARTVANGYAQWDKTVPYGDLTIAEVPAAGYATWRVFCGVYQDDPSEVATYDPVTYTGDEIQWRLDEGYNLICHWFNIAHDGTTITIYKYRCPEGYDAANLTEGYLASYCTEGHAGVDFEPAYGGQTGERRSTDGGGVVSWESAPAGPVSVREFVPPGYKPLRVYCRAYDPAVMTLDDVQGEGVPVSAGGQIAYHIPHGYDLVCLWFNAPHDPNYGTITVYKYVCPEDYDPSIISYGYMSSYCVEPHGGIEFQLGSESGLGASRPTGQDGAVEWTDVEAGAYTVNELATQGYTTIAVYCVAYQTGGGGTLDEPEGMTVTGGATIGYDLPHGYSLICYWYNAPYDDHGAVTIYKYICPEGYDPHALTREYLESYCTEPHQDVRFGVYTDTGALEAKGGVIFFPQGEPDPVSTDADGKVVWEQVAGGGYELRETVPRGYRTLRVYCAYHPASGGPQDWSSMPVADPASVYVDIPAGYSITCYWYNTPAHYGWVEVIKYACPEGYDPRHQTYEQIDYACHEAQENVNFRLEPAQGGAGFDGTTDVDGLLRFDQVEYDVSWHLREEYPAGYEAAVVYCSRYSPHHGAEGAWEPYAVAGGAIGFTLSPGEYLRCRWYDLPAGYGGTIWITKYACADDAVWNYTDDQLWSDGQHVCEPLPHVPFTAWSGTWSADGTTDAAGRVRWEGVSPGPVEIEEFPPLGYGNRSWILCDYGDEGGSPERISERIEGATFEHWLDEGYVLECFWFNFPVADGGQVTVTKYLCPAGADSHSPSRTSLKSKCTPLKGVRFSLAGATGPAQSRITGHGGTATWDGVAAGEIGIAERTLQGYKAPIVYCSIEGGPWDRMAVAGTAIETTMEEGYAIRCDWFNVPKSGTSGTSGTSDPGGSGTSGGGTGSTGSTGGTGTGGGFQGGDTTRPGGGQQSEGDGPASLTIVKYTCEPGFDLYDREVEVEESCVEFEESISFTLEPWRAGDEEGDQSFGAGAGVVTVGSEEPLLNVVTFEDVEAGEYLVTELPPADATIGYAFVLACESSLGEVDGSRFYPLALTRDNLSLRLTLYPGESLSCSWYNVPLGENALAVTVYDCPGQVANPARCVLASEPVLLFFYPIDEGSPAVEATTDANGEAVVPLEPGTYEIDDESGEICLVDSTAIDDSGNIVMEAGAAHEAVIYRCAQPAA